MIARLALTVLVAGLVASCSSGGKKEVAADAAAAAPAPVLTSDAITQKYSLQQLNGAANALKVVFDTSMDAPKADKGREILGCSMTGPKAMSMTMPLKSLIDQQQRAEIEAYESDPKEYANTQGFESCASICACGVYSEIVNTARESAMPKGMTTHHGRNKAKLRAKAERQTADASLACARKQTWFCSSDLKQYLEKEVGANQ